MTQTKFSIYLQTHIKHIKGLGGHSRTRVIKVSLSLTLKCENFDIVQVPVRVMKTLLLLKFLITETRIFISET